MSETKLRRLITNIQPTLIVPADPFELLERLGKESRSPLEMLYALTVELSVADMTTFMAWLAESGVLAVEAERIKDGKTQLPVQLMLEFKQAVEVILKEASR